VRDISSKSPFSSSGRHTRTSIENQLKAQQFSCYIARGSVRKIGHYSTFSALFKERVKFRWDWVKRKDFFIYVKTIVHFPMCLKKSEPDPLQISS